MNKHCVTVLVLCLWIAAGYGVASAAELRMPAPDTPGPVSETGGIESPQRPKPVARPKILNIHELRKRMFINRVVPKKNEFKASQEKP